MKSVIINADDFGMSEAFNHGVIKAYADGVVSSTSIMINLPTAVHALELANHYPDLFIGLHVNLVLGKPCADPALIPSLLDEQGKFYGSAHYRNGSKTFEYEAVKIEILAQMERYKALTGAYPKHIEGHAVGGEAVERALYDVAIAHNVHISPMNQFVDLPPLEGYKPVHSVISPEYMSMLNRGVKLEDFYEDRIGLLKAPENAIVELHFHPGYIDQYILDHSSLTLGRCQDLDTLCKPELKKWLAENHFKRVHFGNL
ncbi:ChbG/HpnK family deacetylase [Fusibacter ferrireducens]|uniref:ChbG/HpnK family deacetylase n=1 Tax=Fusibacter ferrireducens TaxID=2785058 RepID=A0ABR9ZPX9_9FIRM|nr:ChbG/HpnK family deacetylase [Fusibacter ferrireducens]MBF4692518.1 ChbG/HpnK family deacetylase [Fusibacter ferrireducens]